MWQPIETAPKDRFLLLCGPSGYTTIPLVFTTGRMCSDYHAGRWIDHANDDLSDWGFEPTHWAPLPEAPDAQAQPAPSVPREAINKMLTQLMDLAVSNGANSISMPDEYVEVAAWLCGIPAQPAPSVPKGWLRAIDEALVAAHIGTANADDTYEQAKAKLDSLIGFHVDVATDPAVNGGWRLVPVEPTKKMVKAYTYMQTYGGNSPQYMWAAMLAAAPETKEIPL